MTKKSTEKYPDLALLEATILKHLTPDLCAPAYRVLWSDENPTLGFCSVASEAAWFLLGGKPSGWMSYVGRDDTGCTHWWLQKKTGEIFDPTRHQYENIGKTPPYESGRPCAFMGIRKDPKNTWGFERRPGRRAEKLLIKILGSSPPKKPTQEKN